VPRPALEIWFAASRASSSDSPGMNRFTARWKKRRSRSGVRPLAAGSLEEETACESHGEIV